MRTLCRRAGVTYFRFHALRHFGASVLDRANISLGSIQRILGHENRTTTEIYLHSIDEVDRAAMAYLGGEIEKKSHTDSHTEVLQKIPFKFNRRIENETVEDSGKSQRCKEI